MQGPGKKLMLFFFRSNVWKWGARRRNAKACPSTKTDPLAYTIAVYRDEVALSRLIKRLSASGAEHIRVAYTEGHVACVRMQRPATVADWDAIVDRLVDQCGLRYAAPDD